MYVFGVWEDTIGVNKRKLYSFGGHVVAQHEGNGTLTYIHGDRLSSVSVVTDADRNLAPNGKQEFGPWGNVRSGNTPSTTLNYTGQWLEGTGLLFYNARYYDPAIGRFISADTIVPGSGPLTVTPNDAVAQGMWAKSGGGTANPQELNRYSYVNNNPVKNTDPTGHCIGPAAALCVQTVAELMQVFGSGSISTNGSKAQITIDQINSLANGVGDLGNATKPGWVKFIEAVIGINAKRYEGLSLEQKTEKLGGELTNVYTSVSNASILFMAKKEDVRWVDYLVKKYGLSRQQRRELHDDITKKNYTKEEIEDMAKDIADQDEKKGDDRNR